MIRRFTQFSILMLCALFIGVKSNAQISITPTDTALCPGDTLTITASFTSQFDNITTDDVFGNLLNIGFDFEFYGQTFNQVVISANNFLSFVPGHANGSSNYVYTSAVTSGQLNRAIMFPYQDINMGVTNPGQINYQSFGNVGNRVFVVEFCETVMFSCQTPAIRETNQVVLYENGGIIEMFIKNKTACNGWQQGTGIQGLRFDNQQDLVPGRDVINTPWNATNDGKRFTPNATGGYTIDDIPYEPIGILSNVDINDVEWYEEGNPTPIGMGESITVEIQPGVSFYEARLVDEPCMIDGEDTIRGFALIHDAVVRDTTVAIICQGDSINFRGNVFTSSAIYEETEVPPGGGCPTIHRLELTVNPQPKAEWLLDYNDAFFCKGGTTSLILKYPFPGQIYTWYQDQIEIENPLGNSHILPINVAGEYSVLVSNEEGCSDFARPIVVREEVVDIDFKIQRLFGCDGDSIQINNLSENGLYSWTFGVGVQVPDTNRNPGYFYHNQGEYDVKLVMINENGCKDSLTKTVDTRRDFEVYFLPSEDSLCEDLYQSIYFENLSYGNIAQYHWDMGTGQTTNAKNPSQTYYYPGTYEVVLTATDSFGCTKTHSHLIFIDSLPEMDLKLSTNQICEGDIVFFDLEGHTSSLSLTWDFGDGSTVWYDEAPVSGHAQHSYPGSGFHYVTLTATPLACPPQELVDTVYIFEMPIVKLAEDSTLCLDAEGIPLSNISGRNYPNAKYLWSTGSTDKEIIAREPASYTLTIDNSGCIGSETIVVNKDCYLNIPNAFTPNGDGENEYFLPRDLLSKGVVGFTMEIYNRWGQKIFETDSPNGRGWDGKFNDVEQPTGVYVYKIIAVYKNGRIEDYTGNVTLLR